MKRWVLLLGLVLASLACSLSAPTPVAWSGTPTAQARNATSTAFSMTQAAEMTAMPTLPLAITTTSTPRPSTPTSESVGSGPWLIFPSHDGAKLNAFDIHTQAFTTFDLPPLVNLSDLVAGCSPDGKSLLVRAGSVENLNELALYRIGNPNEPIEKITPLLSVYMQRQVINQAGKRPARALSAVIADDSIAWSGDNRQVVISAALDSDSTDLYLWDGTKDGLERLTGKYTYDLAPQWSPLNDWILFKEADGFEEGIWKFTAVSAFRIPRYDETRFLYLPPAQTSLEHILGWVNPDSFISYSCTAESCQKLRLVNLESTEIRYLYIGNFSEVSLAPEAYALALIIESSSAPDSGDNAGVYLSAYQGAPFNQIMAGDYGNIEWSEAGKVFFVIGKMGVTGIRLDNSSFNLEKETNALFSPNGAWLVGWNSGESNPGIRLYSATGSLLQSISGEAVHQVVWQEDTRGFLMVTDSGLWQVAFPGLKPKLITDDILQGDLLNMVWLNP